MFTATGISSTTHQNKFTIVIFPTVYEHLSDKIYVTDIKTDIPRKGPNFIEKTR
jgi:hypothetical protein